MTKVIGKVVGFELNSQEPEKAAEFYTAVFGWKVADLHWDYRVVSADGAEIGGIARGPADFPHGIRIQIEVDRMEDAISKAIENGAMVVRDKMEFDDFHLAYLVDPTGNGIGLIQYK